MSSHLCQSCQCCQMGPGSTHPHDHAYCNTLLLGPGRGWIYRDIQASPCSMTRRREALLMLTREWLFQGRDAPLADFTYHSVSQRCGQNIGTLILIYLCWCLRMSPVHCLFPDHILKVLWNPDEVLSAKVNGDSFMWIPKSLWQVS